MLLVWEPMLKSVCFFPPPGENQPLEKMRKEERIIPITEECALDPRLGYIYTDCFHLTWLVGVGGANEIILGIETVKLWQ